MSREPRKRLALWAILLGLVFPAACGSSGVVGGSCGPSYIDCNGRCVDAQHDPSNCGGCGRACPDGVACHDAVCEASLEGGAGASGTGAAGGDTGSAGDAGSASSAGSAGDDPGNLSDASPDADAACLPPFDRPAACGDCQTKCSLAKPLCSPDALDGFGCVALCKAPLVECDGQCVLPLFDSPEACGACDAKCPVNKPTCSPNDLGSYECVGLCKAPLVECNAQCLDPSSFDSPEACGGCDAKCPSAKPTCAPDGLGGHECVLICADMLQECDGKCLDFQIDADNCGSCENACPSGICQGGKCVGANVGHIVLSCMNYQTPLKNSPQTALMGNAVLLPIRNPVRILAYTEFAPAAARAKVDQDIGFAASARGRSVAITPLDQFGNATATLNIANYDVFLIYDQSAAEPGRMATVGAAWLANSVLDSFAAAGGVIIGLSGGQSEMAQFFSASQLLEVSAQTMVSNATLYNRAPADALGINVISPFNAPLDSCTFTTNVTADADNIFVVSDAKSGPGAPVVVHRVIEPP